MSSENHKPLRVSFGLRLALIYTLALSVSLGALFVVTYQLVRRVVQNRDHQVIEAQTAQFKALLERGGMHALAAYFSQPIAPSPDPTFVRILNDQNQILFLTGDHPFWTLLDQKTPIPKETAQQESRWDELFRDESSGSWIVGTTRISPRLYLQVGRSNTESRLVLSHFRKIALHILLPAALFSLLLGWLMTRRALAPLHALIKTVRHILETGDLKRRVPLHTQGGELGTLTTLFNRMLNQNEKLIQTTKETFDHVAHDLRTPMTHLRNSAERALQQTNPAPHLLQEALSDCMEESEQILHMLNVLMEMAEADTGRMRLQKEELALRELADEVIELYTLVAEERRITLQNEVAPWCSVTADRLRLHQCLANLVDNALKYSPEGSTITLFSHSASNWVDLGVQDHGIGIAPKDVTRIWDRLYRAEHSRSTPGLGLGLSLVRAVIEAHGGTVSAQSQIGQGSCFTLRLPRRGHALLQEKPGAAQPQPNRI